MALNSVGIAVLALMAALYHTFNHAMFKGELFLGAGALLYSTGTRNMEKMGGLFRRMPATAICFLVGALAISAIPPFNGFVSEWFTYQSLFNAAMQGDKAVMIVAVFAAVALAITGALAVTCFVKAYGVSFASAPRSEAAANAKEVPAPMVFAQGLLAAICVVLGIGAPVIAPVLVDVAASVLYPYGGVFAAEGMELMNQYSGAATSTPAIAIALVVLVGLACGYRKLKTVGKVQKSQPWACAMLQRAYARRGHDLCLRGVLVYAASLHAARPLHGRLLVHRALLPEAHRCGRGCGARTRQGSRRCPA
ncbi:MAG: proton-conducting transporter membrane subunit [Collinsella sp.]